MKTFSEFLEEALISSLIKAAARQFVQSKALQKAIPKVKTIPTNAPEKIKLASNITGFRSGGASRGPNFDPMKGSKYQFDPVNRTSISNTAPSHTHTPAGIKPKSTRTYFDTPKNIITAKQNKDYSTLGKDPKIGLTPFEAWKTGDYPAGVEYAHGKFSQANWSPTHAGSPIVDIQTQTLSKNNLPLFDAEREEIKRRIAAGLKNKANRDQINRELGLKNKANQDQIKRELGIEPMDSSNSSTTYRNLGAGRKESVKEQKTFSQFINSAETKSAKKI